MDPAIQSVFHLVEHMPIQNVGIQLLHENAVGDIAEVSCFGAVPARTTATDREVQGGFGQFLYPGNPEITAAWQLSRERLM